MQGQKWIKFQHACRGKFNKDRQSRGFFFAQFHVAHRPKSIRQNINIDRIKNILNFRENLWDQNLIKFKKT